MIHVDLEAGDEDGYGQGRDRWLLSRELEGLERLRFID